MLDIVGVYESSSRDFYGAEATAASQLAAALAAHSYRRPQSMAQAFASHNPEEILCCRCLVTVALHARMLEVCVALMHPNNEHHATITRFP